MRKKKEDTAECERLLSEAAGQPRAGYHHSSIGLSGEKGLESTNSQSSNQPHFQAYMQPRLQPRAIPPHAIPPPPVTNRGLIRRSYRHLMPSSPPRSPKDNYNFMNIVEKADDHEISPAKSDTINLISTEPYFSSEEYPSLEHFMKDPYAMILDTGATRHIFNKVKMIKNIRKSRNRILDDNGGFLETTVIGNAGALRNIILSPKSPKNIISSAMLLANGYSMRMSNPWTDIFDADGNLVTRAFLAPDSLTYLTDSNLIKADGI